MEPQDDPEARIRELERSLSDTSAKWELGTAQRRTGAGLPARTIVLGVATIGLAALGAGVAVFAGHSKSGSPAGSPRAHSSSTSKTVGPVDQSLQTLYHLLPHGYDSTNCAPVDSPNRQASATLQCGPMSDPHSPAAATFSLYPNAAALTNAFQNGIDEDTVTPCPNGNQSPATWSTDAAPNQTAGSVLCGNYENRPDLLWTNSHDLLLSDIQGPNLTALYQFWQNL